MGGPHVIAAVDKLHEDLPFRDAHGEQVEAVEQRTARDRLPVAQGDAEVAGTVEEHDTPTIPCSQNSYVSSRSNKRMYQRALRSTSV